MQRSVQYATLMTRIPALDLTLNVNYGTLPRASLCSWHHEMEPSLMQLLYHAAIQVYHAEIHMYQLAHTSFALGPTLPLPLGSSGPSNRAGNALYLVRCILHMNAYSAADSLPIPGLQLFHALLYPCMQNITCQQSAHHSEQQLHSMFYNGNETDCNN